MNEEIQVLLPVGRLVQGSLYNYNTTDAENRPLVHKTGKNAGKPRVEYYFAVAILKGVEKHWSETKWGQKIYAKAHQDYPNGQFNSPAFAWKIIDGDSTIPDRDGNRQCDKPGFKGNWVIKCSSGYAPVIYNRDGTALMPEENAINLGDYVEVLCSVRGNGSTQQPGIYVNFKMLAFAGYGERIITAAKIDPLSVGFGKSQLPPGASVVPLSEGVIPETTQIAAPPVSPAAPYTAILTPPARKITAKANGATYDQLIAAGWTEELLIQHGMMEV